MPAMIKTGRREIGLLRPVSPRRFVRKFVKYGGYYFNWSWQKLVRVLQLPQDCLGLKSETYIH